MSEKIQKLCVRQDCLLSFITTDDRRFYLEKIERRNSSEARSRYRLVRINSLKQTV